MKLIFYILFFPLICFSQTFEGAVGWGSSTTFPTSIEVYVVTNLNNSGTGSIRDAVTSSIISDGRIITFNGLSGWIELDSRITFSQAGKTIYIAGQTSENGIGLKLSSSGDDDMFEITNGTVIIRAITFAAGVPSTTNNTKDTFSVRGGSGHIFDRCTFAWGTDGTFDSFSTTDVTVSNCLITESLVQPTSWTEDRGRANLLTGNNNRWTLYRNLYANNRSRNPLWGGTTLGDGPGEQLEFVQNVIYNWNSFGLQMVSTTSNISASLINNVGIDGPNTSSTRGVFALEEANGHEAYLKDNYADRFRTLSSDPDIDALVANEGSAGTGFNSEPIDAAYVTATAYGYPLDDITTLTRTQVIDTVLSYAGDPNDVGSITSRAKGYVSSGTGSTEINQPSDVGGYLAVTAGTIITDSDSDGIPDSEEATWGDDTFGYVNSLISGALPPSTPSTPSNGKSVKNANLRINGGSATIKSN